MKKDHAMARRMTLIVLTDFLCWMPIIVLGFASLGGATIPTQVVIVMMMMMMMMMDEDSSGSNNNNKNMLIIITIMMIIIINR